MAWAGRRSSNSNACLPSEALPLHLIAGLYVREFRVKDATFLADKSPRLRYPCNLRKSSSHSGLILDYES